MASTIWIVARWSRPRYWPLRRIQIAWSKKAMTTPKPEPASEAPKVGSEGPIDWEKAELWAAGTAQGDARLSQVQAARALLALRAEVERLRPAAEKWFEECATAHLNPPYHVATLQTDLAAERAAREKAEARVREPTSWRRKEYSRRHPRMQT